VRWQALNGLALNNRAMVMLRHGCPRTPAYVAIAPWLQVAYGSEQSIRPSRNYVRQWNAFAFAGRPQAVSGTPKFDAPARTLSFNLV
jgi:hypothetical protein